MENEKAVPISDSTHAIVFTNHEKQSYIIKVKNKQIIYHHKKNINKKFIYDMNWKEIRNKEIKFSIL